MQTALNPYLSFGNQTREAMTFYKTVFGGTLDINTFKEFQASGDPSEDNKVMHSMLKADNGITFMASDTPNSMKLSTESSISMSLSGDNDEELRGYFEKLSEDGAIVMPIEKAPWGDAFGMVTDKYKVTWMVNIAPKQ